MSHRFSVRFCCGVLLFVVFSFAFPIAVFPQSAPVSAILATSAGKLVVGSDHGLYFHDAVTLERGKRIASKIEKIYAIRVSADGKSVAVVGGTPAELGVIEIYSLPGFEKTHRLAQFDDIATDVAWISNDEIVACSMTGECSVFRLDQESSDQGKPHPIQVHSKGVLAVAGLMDGQVISCGLDSTIRIWQPNQPQDAQVLNNHLSAVNDFDVRPQADKNTLQTIVSASDDGTVRFWQPTIGRMLRFVRLESIPTCVIWNHDGTLAIAGCRDGAIRVIDPTTAKVVRTINGSGWIHCLAPGIDNNRVFVGGEHGISIAELNPVQH